jgi:exodeoxyribonuclease-3
MKIASWNINSVRLRAPIVLDFLNSHQPDVLCLQETKTPDEHFPHDAFKGTPYKYIHMHGMKGYNGVAIISKIPFVKQDIHHRACKEDCRHIAVTLEPKGYDKPVTIHNLYIPAGGDEPDRGLNDKFDHKLNFVEELTTWFPEHHKKDEAVIAVGDFNIAPLEHDVWSHKQLLSVVSHTPIEVEKLTEMQQAMNWIDTARHFVPEDQKLYSWWSYRSKDWLASNRGRRLDHIWATPVLEKNLKSHTVFAEPRGWDRPSDHVPIITEFSF